MGGGVAAAAGWVLTVWTAWGRADLQVGKTLVFRLGRHSAGHASRVSLSRSRLQICLTPPNAPCAAAVCEGAGTGEGWRRMQPHRAGEPRPMAGTAKCRPARAYECGDWPWSLPNSSLSLS